MTSTNTESAQQDLEGRSVRNVVGYSPEQVNDAWCRKVLRKILQSLELQYAMQMPHRAITPDTIVFHANGEPFLISDDIDAAPAPDAHQVEDLTALARALHYAITHELAPAGPLAGRIDGYSAALLTTLDACMDPDPAHRPRSIKAVQDLLGIGAPGLPASAFPLPDATPPPPSPAHAAAPASALPTATSTASALPPALTPAPVERPRSDPVAAASAAGIAAPPDAAAEVHRAGTRGNRRWAIAAGGGAIAIALALVLFAELRDAGRHDHIVPALAPAAATVTAHEPAAAAAAGAAGNVAGSLPDYPASGRDGRRALGASSGGATQSGGGDGDDKPDHMNRVAPNPASAAGSVAATPPRAVPARSAAGAPAHGAIQVARTAVLPDAVPGHAIYQLQIKPWGNVFVDGVDRGASPPVKRLALTPGRHTIRITNPQYRDSVLEFDSAQTTSNGKIIIDFNDEAR
jgi:hypothetical protein